MSKRNFTSAPRGFTSPTCPCCVRRPSHDDYNNAALLTFARLVLSRFPSPATNAGPAGRFHDNRLLSGRARAAVLNARRSRSYTVCACVVTTSRLPRARARARVCVCVPVRYQWPRCGGAPSDLGELREDWRAARVRAVIVHNIIPFSASHQSCSPLLLAS